MHIGFILDGNRRWAKKRFLPEGMGHQKGSDRLGEILKLCPKNGVKVVTAYILSTENFQKRTEKEIEFLFDLIGKVSDKSLNEFIKSGVKIKVLGSREGLPENILERIKEAEEKSKDGQNLVLQICMNYGGKDEIIRSINRVLDKKQPLNEENISANLDSDLEPDMVIRTGGAQRFSNFLIWQSSYSELYFTDVLWPDFDEKELQKALDFYQSQKRNFGK
jgi:undecaprenyl diphosphate synthase